MSEKGNAKSGKMLKVLFIRPPGNLGILTKISSSDHPINILYLAAYLREQGHHVRLYDMEVQPNSAKDIRHVLKRYSPDVACISCMTPVIATGHKIASIIKRHSKGILTVVGGAHVTAIPEETMDSFPDFDVGVVGEGELTLAEICERFSSQRDCGNTKGIEGTVYRNGKKVVLAPPRQLITDLDSLPFPARDLLDFEAYRGGSKSGISHSKYRITQIFTSRGCPFMCTFCAIHLTSHRRVRFRSVDDIVAEIKACMDKYGINHFCIHDDTFSLKESRVAEICSRLKELGVSWDCDTRVDTITEKMIKMMADSGCKRIAFGVESGSPRILKLIKKNVTLDQVKKAFKWTKKQGMMSCAYFIIGSHPDENLDDIEMTKRLMKEIKADIVNLAIGVPYPGTELFDDLKRRGFLKNLKWEHYMHYNAEPVWRTEHFSPKELVNLQKSLIKEYYLRPSYIISRLVKIRSAKELGYWISSGMVTLKYLFQKKV